MTEKRAIPLAHRSVLAVAGEDRRSFLQGLVSNDVNRVEPGAAIWSAFLTPQGKFLHEFFLAESDDTLLLDCEAERLEDLRKRLSLYKLRSKVSVAAAPQWAVFVLLGAPDGLGGVAFRDPRLAEAGWRALLPAENAEAMLVEAGFAIGAPAEYERLRLSLGLPEGSRDLQVDKAILLENGFDELNGVDWKKGCYMGQELTARTRYRGLVKKRLLPVTIDGPAPEPGTPLMLGEVEAGEMRSSFENAGLALIRLEHLERAEAEGLTADGTKVTPRRPAWLVLQQQA